MNNSPYDTISQTPTASEIEARSQTSSKSRPIATYSIIAVTSLIYILQQLTTMDTEKELAQFMVGGNIDFLFLWGSMMPERILQGQVWRLITPVLLHLSLLHITVNMYSLYAIGPSVEQYFGRGRFLALYLLGALGGNLVSFYMNPDGISAGASTSIFVLVAAYAVFVYLNRMFFGGRHISILRRISLIILINMGIGLFANIDNWGNFGGLMTGLAFAWFGGPHYTFAPTEVEDEFKLIDCNAGRPALTAGIAIAVVLVGLAVVRIMTH